MSGFVSDSIARQTLIERAGHTFPHPYFDIASQYVPRNIKDAFRWAEYLYYKKGIFYSASNRIVRYLITDIQYGGERNEEVEKYEDTLEKKLHIRQKTIEGGTDLMTYGNHLASVYFPFDRFLKCTNCGFTQRADNVDYTFQDFKFIAKCRCKHKGELTRIDRPVRDPSRVQIIRWNPKEIELEFHPIAQRRQYYWKIPQDFIKKIKTGDQFMINWTPWEIIECIKKGEIFQFAPNQVFHRSMPSLAGLSQEWGIPPAMSIFTLAWYVAIMRRMNEAIANDFIIPFRVIFPQAQSSSSDPATFVPMGNFVSQMKNMIRSHRRDPGDHQISPIPIGYQSLGGEGKALDLSQNIKSTNEEILNALGYPSELWYGTLSIQAMPSALRMFENNWRFMIDSNNDFLQWVANKVAAFFDWDKLDVSFRPLKIADDMERRQMLFQMMASRQVSGITALDQYGVDFKEEQEKLLEEQQIMQDLQQKADQMAQEMAEVQTAEGGGGASTVYSVEQQADQLAQELVSLSQAGQQQQVDQTLNDLSQSDYTLYALVKDKMEKIRSQMRSDAGAQAFMEGVVNTQPGGVTGQGQPPM